MSDRISNSKIDNILDRMIDPNNVISTKIRINDNIIYCLILLLSL